MVSSDPAVGWGTGSISNWNFGCFDAPADGQSERPDALRAYAPTSVSAMAPPVRPNPRGCRLARRQRPPPCCCAPRINPSPRRRASRHISRKFSCTMLCGERRLNGLELRGSGIPENG
jgi:hypothetical protein